MLSFRNRLLILLIGLVVGAQIVTLFTALARTSAEERKRADAQLVAGAQIARQVLQYRERSLANAVTVLVSDFGLREAVAFGDAPTLASALDNHGARIGADLTLALDLDGNVIAHGQKAPVDDAELMQALRRMPSGAVQHAGFLVTSSGIYQVFAAPVLAPDAVGSVVLGFSVDDRLAGDLRSLVGVEVAFLTGSGSGFRLSAGTPALQQAAMQDLATTLRTSAEVISLGSTQYLATAAHLSLEDPPLDIALLKPMDEVMAPFRRLAWILGTIFGISLVLAVIAGLYLGRSAARPVQRLAAVAERVAAGDYSQQADSAGGREFAHLARAFNGMQAGIAERESQLKHLALHDATTGLANRTQLQEWLAARLAQPDMQTVIVQFVVTNLPEISASLGFRMAEQLIRHVASQLSRAVQDDGIAARLDGAEFAVACGVGNESQAALFASRVRERCLAPLTTEGVMLQAALVLGVAIAPRDANAPDEALRCAHAAIEAAQTAAQPIGFFTRATDEAQRRRLKLGADLPGALRDGQLYLLYQPKVRMRDRRIGGVEALLRWQHPLLGAVSPAEFIPIAERTGASALLTRWVLRAALEQLSAWHAQGLRMHVAVNLSAADLLDETLLQDILGALRDFRMPAGSLKLEITESVLLRDAVSARRNIELLRLAGVRFSVDDFGTGYSSLSQLRELSVDELKIDQSFVRTATRGPEDVAVMKAIVEMAHGLGLRTVAEGVELESQWDLLASLGCDSAQGYLISRPAHPADLEALLRRSGTTYESERTGSARVLELRRRDS